MPVRITPQAKNTANNLFFFQIYRYRVSYEIEITVHNDKLQKIAYCSLGTLPTVSLSSIMDKGKPIMFQQDWFPFVPSA